MWKCERHDKITYLASNGKGSGGTITKQTPRKWHAESDDTGETATLYSLTKAFFWVQFQAELSERQQ